MTQEVKHFPYHDRVPRQVAGFVLEDIQGQVESSSEHLD